MLTKPDEWIFFFPKGTRVIALPNWKNPRLLLPFEDTSDALNLLSRFFGVYSKVGRIYKSLLKAWISIGKGLPVRINNVCNCIEPFVKDSGIKVHNVVVMIGRPSPIQKIKILLLDEMGNPTGFIKYADLYYAQKRITHEWKVLKYLPTHLAPLPLKIGKLMRGTALLMSPLSGMSLGAKIPPPDEVLHFYKKFFIHDSVEIDKHPWIESLKQEGFPYQEWLEPLRKRKWEVVIEHGDFVPWNLILTNDGIVAVDWEFSNLQGFPYIDLVYYILQIAKLIYKWPARKTFRYTQKFLVDRLNLTEDIASSLVKLGAYESFRIAYRFTSKGYECPIQRWRSKIWNIK